MRRTIEAGISFLLFVVLISFLVSFFVPAHAWESWQRSATMNTAVDNTIVTFTLPRNVGKNNYLYVPTIDSAAVTLSCSLDGTTYGVIASNYSATALIDFTYAATTGGKTLKLPDISACRYLKVTFGAEQQDNVVLRVFGN